MQAITLDRPSFDNAVGGVNAKVIEAIYEGRVIKPLKPLSLPSKKLVLYIEERRFSDPLWTSLSWKRVRMLMRASTPSGEGIMRVVLDTSVIAKALLKPRKSLPKEIFERESETHRKSKLIIHLCDSHDVALPKAGLVEVASVLKRNEEKLSREGDSAGS
ncbi:antitoxin family protein [Thermococcus sp. Bubb.Bath]|uniref:antitoxin AF2212-like protein n=1 Tax=Thermococcus sp. Bubb.Bath TaxID=1638242 RepID=UPI00143AF0CB